jgi:two-component system phosphate regulon response regulator PhoB
MFVQDSTAELWSDARVKCVLVPRGPLVEVELRNADGSAFLRKSAPTREAALNEAEYLRLLLRSAGRPSTHQGLKPFALVLENDPDDHDALSRALRLSGMRALTCRSGRDGIALAGDLAPDLIVVDYSLTGLTGAEVCRRLKESVDTANIPIIAVTAAPEALRAEGCRADAVLARPCQAGTLLAAARLFVRDLASPADLHS